MSLAAGRLNQRVTVLHKVVVRDALGGEGASSWAPVFQAWAEVEPMRMREYLAARAGQVDLTCRICLRYRAGVTADMRVQHGAAVYEIVEIVDPFAKHETLEILCSGPAVAT